MNARGIAINVGLAALYSVVFAQCYDLFLYRHYEYVGYALYSRSTAFIALSYLMAVAPVALYRGPNAISSVVSVFVYLLLYVPIIVTFARGSSLPVGQIALIQTTFMAGMALLFLADLVIVRSPFSLDGGVDLLPMILGLTVAGTLYMMVVYRGNLTLPSFGAALYEERFAKESLGAGLATRYISSWLATVLVPLCFAYALAAGKRSYFLAATAACLVLYMAAANKIVILLPFVYVGFYVLVRHRVRFIFPVLGSALAILISALILTADPDGPSWVVASILLNRTIGNGGQITMAYYDFFAVHPQTDYSHVTGIRLLTHSYPYGDLQLGQVIGQFYWSPFMNANANFWATDGIAAMGLAGVAVVSVVCALLFAAMNSVTRTYDTLFVVLAFIPFVITLLNQSLFSSIWSGGAFFLLLFFLFNKRNGAITQRLAGDA